MRKSWCGWEIFYSHKMCMKKSKVLRIWVNSTIFVLAYLACKVEEKFPLIADSNNWIPNCENNHGQFQLFWDFHWNGYTDAYYIQSMTKVVLLKSTRNLSEEQPWLSIEWGLSVYCGCHEKTSYVSNYAFFTLLHKWVNRGQIHHFEKLQ